MVEYFLAGAYAGIPSVITPQYSIYKTIKEVSDGLGLDVPSRTLVIYANKEAVYEFFCYPENIKKIQERIRISNMNEAISIFI